MFAGRNLSLLLACFISFSCRLTNSALLNKRAHIAVHGPVAAWVSTVAAPYLQAASPLPPSSTAPPLLSDGAGRSPTTATTPPAPSDGTSNTGVSGCVPYQCNLFYQNVNVYYWPTGTKNETCGAGGAEPPTPAPPPGLSPISPSIYAIFPSISANNGCSQIGSTYSTKTTSYAPGALSTLVSPGVYRQLNVADLECGADPLISPPPFLFQLDPAFGDCIPGASQGVDPATPLATQTGSISGPGKCPDCGKHEKVGVRAPVQTAALA